MGFRGLSALRRHYKGQAGQLIDEFYVPVLHEAVRYDRQAGYFDSISLVQLAAGLASFIQRVQREAQTDIPPMRLITGATWSPEDMDAYNRGLDAFNGTIGRSLTRAFEPSADDCLSLGLPPGWRPEEDAIAADRFATLAWLVASGFLEVRVAYPLDQQGRPMNPGPGGAIFHPKVGLLWDSAGDVLGFQGSVNETGAAWTRNHEQFQVARSWYSELDVEDIAEYQRDFEQIWNRKHPGLRVVDLPDATCERLQRFKRPDGPPHRDPMSVDTETIQASLRDRIEAQWLLDAPKRPGGGALVLQPLWADGRPLTPFPHQRRVIGRAFEGFPHSFLFCDEVGLGKTIEAGLALRHLLLTGSVKRILILAPRSLVRQWMEELREKLALTAWFFDGQSLSDVAGRIRIVDDPLDEDGIVIASRHLLARSDRREQVLRARRWDLVVVDEAHAARMRVFNHEEPNQLLSLLQQFQDGNYYTALWLLTATPMQLAPREVHDLLLLCGLRGSDWGAWSRLREFERFFEQLAAFASEDRVRSRVVEMTRIAVEKGAEDLDASRPPSGWSDFQWRVFVKKVQAESPHGLEMALRQIPGSRAMSVTPHLSRQTPLAVHMFRHTRATLRAYQERGLLTGGLAHRDPCDVPVDFASDRERELYQRIDTLCSQFYRLADLHEGERAGVGFLMAVFRKRLASSFAAFCMSLQRRKDLIDELQSRIGAYDEQVNLGQALFAEEDDDEEEDTSSLSAREVERLRRLARDPKRRAALDEERLFLQTYITDLRAIQVDSKFEAFRSELDRVIEQGHRVIVFTQYLDTLDFIRDRLVARFGSRLACYSGRGGEVWDPRANSWKIVEKAEVKQRARQDRGDAISVLLGTDAASEGLNLQEFSALFNYDLPWNPMRVEQRIGRIDRIGQKYERVGIYNLYVRNTIEEDAYLTLKDRIGAFEEVVGPLQPILAEMPRIFRRVARGEMELEDARRELEAAAAQQPNSSIGSFDAFVSNEAAPEPAAIERPVVTQEQLAAWCLSHSAPGMRVLAVPEPGASHAVAQGVSACLQIAWPAAPGHLGIARADEVLATFDGQLADRHPPTPPTQAADGTRVPGREGVRLLTWGDPLLDSWLLAVRGAPLTPDDFSRAGLGESDDPLSRQGA